MMKNRKIGVLLGGLSAERDISLRSGEAILGALQERGYDACPIFVDRDVDQVLRQARIDVAFLALHGRYGEDGCIQGLLELFGIPYTGSGVLASGLAMNKAKAKEILRWHNLPTAPGYVIDAAGSRSADGDSDGGCLAAVAADHGSFGFPVVVKPAGEGSSLGVEIARDEMELEAAVEEALRYDDEVLVERFIEGKEISVGVLDGKPLGAVEIIPRRGLYDFQSKVTPSRSDYYLPARLSPERYRSALRLADHGARSAGVRRSDPRRSHRQRAGQRGHLGGQHSARADADQSCCPRSRRARGFRSPISSRRSWRVPDCGRTATAGNVGRSGSVSTAPSGARVFSPARIERLPPPLSFFSPPPPPPWPWGRFFFFPSPPGPGRNGNEVGSPLLRGGGPSPARFFFGFFALFWRLSQTPRFWPVPGKTSQAVWAVIPRLPLMSSFSRCTDMPVCAANSTWVMRISSRNKRLRSSPG